MKREVEIIDFHCHAFPDSLAEQAMSKLQYDGEVQASLDGKLSSLSAAMEKARISRAVIASIATKVSQYSSILSWLEKVASDRFFPFPSVHPEDPLAVSRIKEIAQTGFKGIKLHPYYQNFFMDEKRIYPLYETIKDSGLILLMHTGFDIAFERIRRGSPEQIIRVLSDFPELKLICSHFGAWENWDEVERLLLGKEVYMDLSYSLDYLGAERFRDFLLRHPAEYLLFGSDSPWDDQSALLQALYRMDLPDTRLEALLSLNAKRLLGLS